MYLQRTHSRGRGRSGSQGRGSASETVNRPATTAPTRAYAMKAREDLDIPGLLLVLSLSLILTYML